MNGFLEFLYATAVGRWLLKLMVSPGFSRFGGWLLNTRLSALAVRPFVKRHHIDLTQCRQEKFRSYNDFFTRKLREDARPVDPSPESLVSPCDGRLTVHPIREGGRFFVKGREYTLPMLLRDRVLAEQYLGGRLWLFRLAVEDYHRYIYPADGETALRRRIPGVFHTVQPLANEYCPVYHENTRCYCLMHTPLFGELVMMEVGAMLVGRIENLPADDAVSRGQEKGRFAFGGSTIILLTEPGAAEPEAFVAENSAAGKETMVLQGQRVGYAPAGRGEES